MKISRVEKKELFDVYVWNGKICLRIKREFFQNEVGQGNAEIQINKREATGLINALRRARKSKKLGKHGK